MTAPSRLALHGFIAGLLTTLCLLVLAGPAVASGGVLAWGEGEVGQLGDGATAGNSSPAVVSGLSGVTALAGGRRFSLALLADGTVVAWGENGWGQLGDGPSAGPETCHAAYAEANGFEVGCSRTPVAVSGLTDVVAIAAGAQHSLALLGNGTVMAWGDNEYGQLGDGSTDGPDHCYKETEPTQCSTAPIQVPGLSDVTAIAAGQNYSLALLANGTVMAWGSNGSGELGDGSTSSGQATPAPVHGLSGVRAIAGGGASGDTSLALLSNGTVVAWGENEFGELGNGTLAQRDEPVAVSGLSEVSAIAVGSTSLALRDDGTVMAWGDGNSGQMGIGTFEGPAECFPHNFCATTPTEVHGLAHVRAIAAGASHSLALLDDGAVMAWGQGWQGQLGDGSRENRDLPTLVNDLSEATTIAAGENFSLAYGANTEDFAELRPPGHIHPSAPLTNAQKLTAALRACTRKPKRERAACVRRAEEKYRPSKKRSRR
jgi:alpha-tubulin suppressor-like RCC1 family protein